MAGENLVIHGAAAVAYAAGVPGYTWQSGVFTGVITDTGAGDMQLLLNANDGVDAAECACIMTSRGAANYPRQCHFTLVHTSDVSKQVLCSEEAAAGGASVAADVDFDIVIVKWNRV